MVIERIHYSAEQTFHIVSKQKVINERIEKRFRSRVIVVMIRTIISDSQLNTECPETD